MTPLQTEIYEKIVTHYKKHGYSPTSTDIAKEYGVKRQTIDEQLRSIKKKGYIKKEAHRPIVPIVKRKKVS